MDNPTSSTSSSSSSMSSFVLGIDLGTTSVKVCLVSGCDSSNAVVSDLHVKDTIAAVKSDCGGDLGDEQDMSRIYSALHACLARIPRDRLRNVKRIAVSGQMHGVVFWKRGKAWGKNESLQQNQQKNQQQNQQQQKNQQQVGKPHHHLHLHASNSPDHFEILETSHLYTWQDDRCDPAFISSLPDPDSHLRLATGYGCATILWMKRNRPEFLARYDSCGTLMDFVVAMITDNAADKPFMSIHNAASWGYFNTVRREWNLDILSSVDFPVEMLPEVVDPGRDVGRLSLDWFGIPSGTPVTVALGDLQCSVLSTIGNPDQDAVLNISTSAQIAFVMPEGFTPRQDRGHKDNQSKTHEITVEFLPYFGGRYIATSASLSGGNSLAAFVQMIQRWVVDLGLSVPQSKIWETVMAAAAAESNNEAGTTNGHDSLMEIVPRLHGERHSPDERASITNICPGNLSLGKVTRSICVGVVQNLAQMMPPSMLHDAGVKRIVGSGNCLIRNPALKQEVQNTYGLPVEFAAEANACVGAALAVILEQSS